MKCSTRKLSNSMAAERKATPGLEILKIGLVLDGGGLDRPDGVQQYILTLGEWFRSRGHDVHYLVGETARTDIVGVHSLSRNISVTANGNKTSIPLPTSRRKLRAFLDQEQFDVLHVQVPYNPFLGERLVMLASPRTVIIGTFHILPNSKLISWGTKALGLWSRRSLRCFDAMLSVSPAAADFARKIFGTDSVVLPNVIDYKRFHEARPFERYQDGTVTILFLGRLVPRKGCMLLLQAVDLLVNANEPAATIGPNLPPFRLVICGKGPLERSLRQFADEHHLHKIVEFNGFVSEADKPRYYASANLAVFPSTGGESFGIVLLEAMAGGHAAVLAGDNPGYRSVMAPRPELLFDSSEARELAHKLVTFLHDSAMRRAAAQWGEGYAQDFDVNIVGVQLLDIYEQALRKRLQL